MGLGGKWKTATKPSIVPGPPPTMLARSVSLTITVQSSPHSVPLLQHPSTVYKLCKEWTKATLGGMRARCGVADSGRFIKKN